MNFKILIAVVLTLVSARGETNKTFSMDFPRWGPSVRGGVVHNFKTDVDGGGAFSMNRHFVEVGVARLWRFDRMVAFSAGFGQDDYHFSSMANEPWNNIDTYRMSLFARWGLNDKWVLFAGPSLRSYGEAGTDIEDALTMGFFGGASFRFNDRLTLGPGLGVFERIEDRVSYFPVIIVNWDITDRLSLETGGGLAATRGPGLSLSYELSRRWKMGVSARYERKRFRINGKGAVVNGVGEDQSIPVMGILSYVPYPAGSVSAFIGANVSGKLSVEDKNGNTVDKNEYDASVFAGFSASFRF